MNKACLVCETSYPNGTHQTVCNFGDLGNVGMLHTNTPRYTDSVEGFSLALKDCTKILSNLRKMSRFNKSIVDVNQPLEELHHIVDSLGFDSQIMLLVNLLHRFNPESAPFILLHFSESVQASLFECPTTRN